MIAWLLLSIPEDEFKFAGFGPYGDELRSCYRYDSRVPNHKRIEPNHLAAVRTNSQLVGVARIARIETSEGTKALLRCPMCSSTNLQRRKRKLPPFVCASCRASFESPREETVPVTKFAAHFEQPFCDTPDAIPLSVLCKACPKYSQYLSMQRMEAEALLATLIPRFPKIKFHLQERECRNGVK